MSLHRDDPKIIFQAMARYIASAGIPMDWLKTYCQYDAMNDQIMIRIDCMEVTYSSRFDCVDNQAKEAGKLLPEIDRFIMLLWGEPE
jgi:hypothetical protein